MTDDAALTALFADGPTIADDGFTSRVLALAALEDRMAVRRRSAMRRIGIEAGALVVLLSVFALLARSGAASDVVPLTSPAMLGLVMLGGWLTLGMRGGVRT